jgi:hypothetical protein
MGKTKDLGHLAHIVVYDAENHITVPAGITMHTNQLVASQAWVTTALGSYALSSALGSYVPTSRTITINGTTFDLSANRSWDITSMIYPAAGIALSTGTGWGTSITNNSGNWNTAFGWGNHASAGYLTGITSTQVTTALGFTPVTNARTITINGTAYDLSTDRSWTVSGTDSTKLPLAGGTMTGSIEMATSGTSYIRMGRFPNSTSNGGEAWIGRASDRSAGTMTVQLGSANSSFFEVVDYGWTTVTLKVGMNDFSYKGNAVIHAGNIGSQSVSTASAASSATFLTQANATWGARLQIGGNGDPGAIANIAVVQATDGNLHMDSGTGKSMYLNYYRNGVIYLNGATYYISSNGANYNGTAANAGNADTLDGYHGSNYPGKNGNTYYQVETWLQLTGVHGLYCPSVNNAHLYPNDASYGAWRISGTRNGWNGIHFGGGNGMTLMMNETEFGFHREGIGWSARFTSGTGHFNISGSAASASSASSATSAEYFPTAYVGGQQTNPQVYFNNGIGLKAAMTGAWSVWSDTLWVNGYSGGDVPWMCALHFLRNSEPRFAISAQQRQSTSYGSFYEVITSYNIASQTVANLSGFNKSEPTFANVYNTGWFRNYADSGLYNQDYGCHLVRNGQSSHGAWSIFGYTKAGYIGMNLRDPQTYNNNLMYENGNGGMYTENANGWQWYYNRGSNCLGLGGSTTYNWVRAVVNGKLKIESDSIHTGWAYFDSNLQLAGGGNILYNEYNLWYVWRNWGGWGGEWINRNGGDMIMNLYAVYAVTGSVSDIRYKKDITPLSYGLNEIMQMNPIKYHYNLPKESMLANDPDYFLGFSAQEMQNIIPEAVHEKMGDSSETMTGMLAITMDEIIPVLVNGIKEQQVMIRNQNNKINKLEALVNQLLNN